MGKEGVSAPANKDKTGRNERGQWQKGVSGNPAGRPKRGPEHFSHLLAKLPPEKMAEHMLWGIEKAIEQNATKAVLAYGELYYAYLDGKPVQRLIQETDSFDDMLERLKELG